MLFGSTLASPAVQRAIEDAERERGKIILFFAAARNEGGGFHEMFPASLTSVVSVRGTTAGSGFIPDYNPDPQSNNEGTALFGTLAYRDPCGERTISGYSIATPIFSSDCGSIP